MQEIEAPASAEPRDCHIERAVNIEEIKGEVAADGAWVTTAKMAADFCSNICRSKKRRRATKQMNREQIWGAQRSRGLAQLKGPWRSIACELVR